jgi:hypothetical protein
MNRIAFTDVTPQIQQQTAFFANVSSAHPVWVEDQYYDPTDTTVILAGSLFRNAVNHHVLVISVNPTTGQEIKREQAILVSTDGPILRFADRVESQLPPNSRIAYLTLPKVSGTKPALVASLGSTTANRPNLALYYATGGFSWTTDYLARLNVGNDHMDLDAIASVMNQSGLAFDNATLSFVSGTVHREQIYAPEARTLGHVTTTDAYAVNSASDRAARQALLDYYLYTVPHPVSLDSNQTKQISLFSAESVPVSLVYEIDDSNPPDYTSPNGDVYSLPLETYVAFTNQGKGLGIPLPAGVVHLYKQDTAGGDQFVGEDSIDLTARGAAVRLDVGKPFDIKAERVQTSFRTAIKPYPPYPARTFYYADYRISINNAKPKPVAVRIIETMAGQWEIDSESLQHVKMSSNRVKWTLDVPAYGSASLTYSVVAQ